MKCSETGLAWLTLSCLPGVGPVTLCDLARQEISPRDLLACSAPLSSPSRLTRLLQDRSLCGRARDQARRLADQARARGVGIICLQDPVYPPALREIPDPPPLLFYRGDPGCLDNRCVAVVGSRAATVYGREIAFALGRDLAGAGVTVVSGVALGIDGQAHQGALSAAGPTAGVLGCGVDVVYPRTHGELYRMISEGGVLLSEYPCGTRPDGFRFPARNRIIAGLAAAVVVVEATGKSGSLITARLALDQGREVFAVPGRVDSARSDGCHRLIRQGALLIRNGHDVITALGWGEGESEPATGGETGPADSVTVEEQRVLAALDAYPVDIDTLARKTGLESSRLLDLLLRLELAGLVRQYPGQMYNLARR